MSIVERAFENQGIDQDPMSPNIPMSKNRQIKVFAGIIGAIRKIEVAWGDQVNGLMLKVTDLSSRLAHALDRSHRAERECEQLRLKLKIIQGDFSEKDAAFLLTDETKEEAA